jgi:hypothetical protein
MYTISFSTTGQWVKTYFNGTLYASKTLTNVLALEVHTPSSPDYATDGWIGIGCNIHGDGWKEDTLNKFPNNGWFSGFMDDVRIYNRSLSDAEVLALYNGVGTASGSGTNEPPAAPVVRRINAVRANIGTIRR